MRVSFECFLFWEVKHVHNASERDNISGGSLDGGNSWFMDTRRGKGLTTTNGMLNVKIFSKAGNIHLDRTGCYRAGDGEDYIHVIAKCSRHRTCSWGIGGAISFLLSIPVQKDTLGNLIPPAEKSFRNDGGLLWIEKLRWILRNEAIH